MENPQDPTSDPCYVEEDIGSYAILSSSLAHIIKEIKEERVSQIWKMNLDGDHLK